MSAADSATAPGWAAATAGDTYNVQPGTWTHLTVTYNKSANYMAMYVNGVHAAAAQPSATWSSGCNAFTLGRYIDGGQIHGYINGKIADVQVWNGTALTPTQAATLSGTPGYDLFPSDSHQYGSAATPTTWQWVTADGKMQFYQGVLTITETGTGPATKTWPPGAPTNANGVLILQTDGDLVIYTTFGKALWSSGTAN
jgi:hypothetical protein